MIIVYPIFYILPPINDLQFTFNVVYLFFLLFVLLIAVAMQFKDKLLRHRLSGLGVILILTAITVANIDQIRYSKPLLFILVLFLLYFLASVNAIRLPSTFVKFFIAAFLLGSFIFLFSSRGYFMNRFVGFLISPTVSTVYAEGAFVLAYSIFRSRGARIFLIVVFGLLIFLSQTRINILVFALIPVVFFLVERKIFSTRFICTGVLLIITFVYPLYQVGLSIDFIREFLMMRAEAGRDASADLRLYLYAETFNILKSSSILDLLFGHGAEFSRHLMLKLVKEDTYPHNDILRILVDFGVVYTVLFLYLILRIGRTNVLSCALFIIFVSSFYHNMIFDFYIPSLLILLSQETLDDPANFQIASLSNRNSLAKIGTDISLQS